MWILAQIALLLGWFLWPAMAHVPWWVIFLPLEIGAFWFGVVGGILGLAAWANS
jgi:hypothetical protein